MEPVKSNAIRNAWLWLIGVPIAYVLTTLIGYGIFAALGLADGELLPSAWVPVILVIGVVLFAIPTYFAYSNGREAQSAGAKRPFLPALVALFFLVFFFISNLLAYFQA